MYDIRLTIIITIINIPIRFNTSSLRECRMYENIINKFIEAEVLIDDSAYEKITSQKDSVKFAESLIQDLKLPRKE